MLERPRPEHIAFQESPPEPEREATPEEQAAFADSQEQMFQIITKAESSDYLEPLQKLREETGYDLAPETIERAYAYLVENYGRRNWSVSSIDTFLGLHDYTGALPSDATLREMFNQLVRSGSSSAIDCLRRELRAPPVFDDEAVQDGYKELFGSGYIPSKERYRRYEQLTGRAIEETTAQILYGIKAEAGNPDAIRALRKFSGIRPVFDAQSVEKGYDQLVKSGRADDLGKLARQTQVRVELSSEQIDAGFDSLLRNSTGWSFKKRYHAWTAYTRGRPRPKDVQENFRHFITHGRADAIKAIQKITGLRPEPALIDDALERYFIENTSYHSLKPLLEVLGIALAPDLVQRAYRVIVLSDYRARERIKEISGFTGTAPDPGMVAELMEEVLGSASPPYQLNKLIAAGFSPDAARIRSTFDRLIREKNLDDFVQVVVLAKDGARPNEAELEAFFNIVTEMRRDWGLITRLREAGFTWRPEFVHAYYERLNFASAQDMDSLIEVVRATGVLPPEAMTLAAYRKNIEDVQVEMVAKLHELTGTPVTIDDASIVQDAYNEIILKKDVTLVATLKALTGIEPVFVPAAVEARYEWIGSYAEQEYDHLEPVKRLLKLHEVTGLRPVNLNRLTSFYGRLVKYGDVEHIKKLKEALGVGPVWDPDEVKAGFGYLVVHDDDVRAGLDALSAYTGVPVEPQVIQKAYLKCLHQSGISALTRLEKIIPELGVPLGDETIVAAFQKAIEQREYYSLNASFQTIMTLTGKPIPREVAERGMVVSLKEGGAEEERAKIEIMTGVMFTPELIQRAYTLVVSAGNFNRLADIQKETGIPLIYSPELEGVVQASLHRASPRDYVLTFRKLQAIWPVGRELGHHNPWGEMYMRLASVQAPAERAEYDPWKTDLEPLLREVNDRTPEMSENVYEFVKEFGMISMPRVFEWFVRLRNIKTIAELADGWVRQDIEQAFGKSLDEFPTPGAVIAEIKKFKQRIQEDLLRDTFPSEAVKSDAGVEMLLAIRGSGSWSRGGNVRSVMDAWRQTVTDKPEAAAMPEGYTPMAIEVARVERQEAGDEEQRIKKVLDNEDIRLILERMDAPYRAVIRKPFEYNSWWQTAQAGAIKLIEAELASIEVKAAREANPKKLTGMHARIAELRDRIKDVRTLAFPNLKDNDSEDDYAIVQFMESLHSALPEKMPARDDLLRAVSAMHSFRTLPEGQRTALESIARDTSPPHDVRHTEAYHDLLMNFLNEHYLHPDQKHEQTAHAGFSKELLRELRGAWGIKGDLKKHPLVLAAEKVRRLREGTSTDTGKTLPIELVPARGVMRIFAGDVGSACYTSRHSELARGDFPGLTAFIFVTGRGTTQERMRGSVLAIETKTPDDKKVLVVRANNPQEALLSQVKTDELMEKTLDAMIELAVRRGMDYVVVPRDGSSQAATNRPAVFDYYRRAHGDKKKLQLVNEPDTNFNGYNIWEANGQHAVVKVWEKGE